MRSQPAIANHQALRAEVQRLAAHAFHHHLISGYGDGEYYHKFQIVYQGKPRQLSLTSAYSFLNKLLTGGSIDSTVHPDASPLATAPQGWGLRRSPPT